MVSKHKGCDLFFCSVFVVGYNKIKFVTDSEFVINCMTQWIKKWKINNWKVTSGGDVKNKEDLVKLDNLLHSLQDVKWVKKSFFIIVCRKKGLFFTGTC